MAGDHLNNHPIDWVILNFIDFIDLNWDGADGIGWIPQKNTISLLNPYDINPYPLPWYKIPITKKHSIYPAILDYNIMVYQDLDLKIFEYPTKYHK